MGKRSGALEFVFVLLDLNIRWTEWDGMQAWRTTFGARLLVRLVIETSFTSIVSLLLILLVCVGESRRHVVTVGFHATAFARCAGHSLSCSHQHLFERKEKQKRLTKKQKSKTKREASTNDSSSSRKATRHSFIFVFVPLLVIGS